MPILHGIDPVHAYVSDCAAVVGRGEALGMPSALVGWDTAQSCVAKGAGRSPATTPAGCQWIRGGAARPSDGRSSPARPLSTLRGIDQIDLPASDRAAAVAGFAEVLDIAQVGARAGGATPDGPLTQHEPRDTRPPGALRTSCTASPLHRGFRQRSRRPLRLEGPPGGSRRRRARRSQAGAVDLLLRSRRPPLRGHHLRPRHRRPPYTQPGSARRAAASAARTSAGSAPRSRRVSVPRRQSWCSTTARSVK